MMRLRTYAGLSLLATIAVIYHAFNSRAQFYPALVYMSTSKINLVLLLNMGLVISCMLWQITKRIFLGSLREAEVERLNEQSWREIMEMLFAVTIFRQDFSVTFLAMVTALLLIKALHWLAQKRVEYIETTPSVPTVSHVRIFSFMGFLLLIDSLFLYSSVKYLLETRQASVSLFFAFEYMILATTTVSTFVKYVFYVSDMLMEGQWERKAVYTFYLELIQDLLHLSMYLCFFLVIFMNYGVPLHLIRELYETFRNFKSRVADYIRYRKITSNMNDRFPDATAEELNASDATCIICREEMTTAKKLICGHLFHVHCLRSWLERQHTCPTCRAPVVPPENGASTAGGQHGSGAAARRQETSTGSAGIQGTDAGMTSDNLSRHQARLQAATTAASMYGKSFVYPTTNTSMWFPQAQLPLAETAGTDSSGQQTFVRQSPLQSNIDVGSLNLPQPLFQHYVLVPVQAPGVGVAHRDELGSIPNTDLEAQIKLLQKKTEDLERQLRILHGLEAGSNKGNAVASTSLVSESSYHG